MNAGGKFGLALTIMCLNHAKDNLDNKEYAKIKRGFVLTMVISLIGSLLGLILGTVLMITTGQSWTFLIGIGIMIISIILSLVLPHRKPYSDYMKHFQKEVLSLP